MISIKKLFLLLAAIGMLVSCVPSIVPVETTNATLGYVSSVHKDLTSLPPCKEKVYAAVYKFRDQTGQYKSSATGVTWSTAVTQGASSMLLKAIEESNWFIPLEREGLSNLLNERKIIRSTRENFRALNEKQMPALPPLLYAGITFEGGIISYETNTVTGGAGARYFGIGASTEYRKDDVTVYLRAVSTQTGKVLKTVYTSKSIFSMVVASNVYRYVRFKRLLEAEAGFSFNEPPQMCVREAIDKAVLSLIIEGILDNLWDLENPEDIKSPIIKKYLNEKDEILQVDEFYTTPDFRTKHFSFGLNLGGQYYSGDLKDPIVAAAPDFSIRYGLTPNIFLSLGVIWGDVANRNDFTTFMNVYELKGIYSPFPKAKFNPFVFLGGGILKYNIKDKAGENIGIEKLKDYVTVIVGGLGIEYSINQNFSIALTADNHYTFTDQLDGKISGNLKDHFWATRFGFNYYVGL